MTVIPDLPLCIADSEPNCRINVSVLARCLPRNCVDASDFNISIPAICVVLLIIWPRYQRKEKVCLALVSAFAPT